MGKFRDTKPKRKDGMNKAGHSMNPDRKTGAGGNNMRDKSTIKRLQMYRGGKPKRDAKGKITRAAVFQNTLAPGTMSRVAPNRKWFGNTRVITQNALQNFQDEMGKVMKDPYKVVMRTSKLPISLLNETAKNARVHILDTEKFEDTFGPKSHRKRPRIQAGDMESLLAQVNASNEKYSSEKDKDLVRDDGGVTDEAKHVIFRAGQSKRIWNELYKVIDSSDVLIQVLDCRDPMGTRSKHIEEYLKKEKAHKHLILVLNKCDLVPTWVTQKWVAILSAEYPCMAFHSSLTNSFGKGALINLLRQFGKLHTDKKQISIGFIGYPNVGKSSIINTLRQKKVCKVAPIAGETKVWQYVTLMRRIFLIDCPGVVYPVGDTETDTILKGVIRVEYVKEPEEHITTVLERVKPEYIKKTYKVTEWKSTEDFLEQIARKSGKLLKGGEPDVHTVGKMILNDWQRGKIPYFVRPPGCETDPNARPSEESKASAIVESEASTSVDGAAETSDAVAQLPTPEEVDAQVTSSEVTEGDIEKVKQGQLIKVKQDFRKIAVETEFIEEDVGALETEGLSDAEEDDEDEEEEVEGGEQEAGDDPDVQLETIEKQETSVKRAKKAEKVKPSQNNTVKDTKKNKKVISSPVKSKKDRDLKGLVAVGAVAKLNKDKKKNKKQKSASGTFVVSDSGSNHTEKAKSSKGFTAYEVTENDSVACVEVTPPESTSSKPTPVQEAPNTGGKKNKKNRKRRANQNDDVEEEGPAEKLSGKDKRRAYRQQKVTKIGQQYYETANVKNRRNR